MRPPDPYAGLSPETRAWVDRCKQHYLKRLAFGRGIADLSSPEFKRVLREMGRNERRAKARALKDFKRFAKHFDNNGISAQVVKDPQEHANDLVGDFEAELQRRGITLDTANAVFEATKAALTNTRLGKGPGKQSEDVLFLWAKLKADGLSCMREASRIIAHVLRYYSDASPTEGALYQTIRDFEVRTTSG